MNVHTYSTIGVGLMMADCQVNHDQSVRCPFCLLAAKNFVPTRKDGRRCTAHDTPPWPPLFLSALLLQWYPTNNIISGCSCIVWFVYDRYQPIQPGTTESDGGGETRYRKDRWICQTTMLLEQARPSCRAARERAARRRSLT